MYYYQSNDKNRRWNGFASDPIYLSVLGSTDTGLLSNVINVFIENANTTSLTFPAGVAGTCVAYKSAIELSSSASSQSLGVWFLINRCRFNSFAFIISKGMLASLQEEYFLMQVFFSFFLTNCSLIHFGTGSGTPVVCQIKTFSDHFFALANSPKPACGNGL